MTVDRECCRECDELSAAIDALVLARARVAAAGEAVDLRHRLDRKQQTASAEASQPPAVPTFVRLEP